MFEKFTQRSFRVLKIAEQQARRLKGSYVGTEHLLLGLRLEGSGVAANILKTAGVNEDQIEGEVKKLVPESERLSFTEKIPYSDSLKQVLEAAPEEAAKLQHTYVGTEHLLLSILSSNDNTAVDVLRNLGINRLALCGEILNLLGFSDVEKIEERKKQLKIRRKVIGEMLEMCKFVILEEKEEMRNLYDETVIELKELEDG